MNIKLNEVPFSARGSYLALGWLETNFHGWGNEQGLFLRSVHGLSGNSAGSNSLIARISVSAEGKVLQTRVTATPDQMVVNTDKGQIRIVFDGENTLLFEGTGEDLSMNLDFNPIASGAFNLIEQWQSGDRTWYMANVYRTSGRYMMYAQTGEGSFEQTWTGETTSSASYTVRAVEGRFRVRDR